MRIDFDNLKQYNYTSEILIALSLFNDRAFEFITVSDNGAIHVKQQQALETLTDGIVKELGYGGAAGGAKSWTGCTWLLFMCLGFPDTQWFIGREELKRLRESTLITFFKVCKQYGARKDKDYKYNGQDHYIQFSNNSRINLLELKLYPSDPLFERFGSVEYTGGWIEEAGEITEAAFDVLKSRCGRQYNDKYGLLPKVYITFNPKKNFVYQYFYLRDKEKRLPDSIKFIKALLYDNPYRESQYEAQLLSISSIAQKERLLYGNFDYDDDPSALCDYDAICDMFRNEHVKPTGVMYGSADLAMKGRDKFIAGHWNGLIGYPDIIKGKSDGKEIENDCRKLMIQYNIPRSRFVVDSTGMGSYLESYLNGIKEFNFANAAVDKDFVKLKDECAYKLAEMVNKRLIYIVCSPEVTEQIKMEMGVLKADDVDADTKKKKIIPKDKMKELINCSPDYLDWLILRMYFICKSTEVETRIIRSRR